MTKLSKERIREEIKEARSHRTVAGVAAIVFSVPAGFLPAIGILAGEVLLLIAGLASLISMIVLLAMSFYYHARYKDHKRML